MPLLLALLLCQLASAGTKLSLGDKGVAEVQLVDVEEHAEIKIELPDGTHQLIPSPGEHWQFVRGEGESRRLQVHDFDGDGREDFVVRASIPTGESEVFAYHYDAQPGKFVPFLFADDDHVAAAPNGTVEVGPEGIAVDGVEEAAGAPASAHRLWRFTGKRFLPF